VKSGKHRLVELKEKGIEREAGYRARIKRREAVTASYPDEDALEDISIKKYEAGYRLHRTFNDWETESFAKQYCAEGTSVAGKGSSKAEEKTSDYYSMSEHTDHEESSLQQQNSSQNTGGGSPRRKSPSPEDGGSPIKFPRRESNNSSSEEAGGSPRSNFSDSESQLCTEFRGANLGRK